MRAQLARAGTPGPQGDRHRRDLDPQGPHLPHRGQRPGSQAADLVRRHRIARRPAWTQFYAWLGPKKSRRHPPGGDGHVEAVPQRHQARTRRRRRSCSTSSTSCAISARRSTRCARPSTPALSGKDRRFIKGQKYTLLSHRENLTPRRQALAQAAAGRQQAAQHRLPAQGVLRPALGLPPRGLGAALLRQLARQPQVAAAQALRDASPT